MARVILFIFSVFLGPMTSGQVYHFDSLQYECKEIYPDKSFVIYNTLDQYSFYKTSNIKTPLTGKLESRKTLVRLRTNEPLTYFETTNSYSSIQNFSSKEYSQSAGRFINVKNTTSIEHYESGGIFHNDFFVNPMRVFSANTGVFQIDYTKLFNDYKFLATIHFSGGTPTLNERIEILVPSWLEVEFLEQNFELFDIQKSQTQEKEGIRYIYSWNNIPKFEIEDFSPSSRHYLPHIIMVYKKITDKGDHQVLMPNTKELYGWYSSLVGEIGDKPDQIEPLVSQFKDLPKGNEQLDAVHSWIRDNIRYIAFESGIAGFKPESCQNVYENRYGDCKGMANLCKNTLIALGYDARLAWIGTRREIPYGSDIPSLTADNHMITAVKVDGSFIYIDATETYGRTEEYAYRIQGRPVMIEDNENYIISHVPKSGFEADRVIRNYQVCFDASTLTTAFSVTEIISGEPKKSILSGFNYTFAKDRTDALEHYLRPNNTGSFTLHKSEGLDKADDHITFAYTFTTADGVIDLGEEFYLDIDPTYELEAVILNEDRRTPWFFDEKYHRETHINFDIPNGYEISHLPESFEVDNENFKISVKVQRKEGSLEIFKEIKVYDGIVAPKYRASWEKGIQLLKKYYEDRLVISKHK